MVMDHEGEHPSRGATIMSIAGKIGCTAQTPNEWVKKAEVDRGRKAGLTASAWHSRPHRGWRARRRRRRLAIIMHAMLRHGTEFQPA
jgi:transposase-like protein